MFKVQYILAWKCPHMKIELKTNTYKGKHQITLKKINKETNRIYETKSCYSQNTNKINKTLDRLRKN